MSYLKRDPGICGQNPQKYHKRIHFGQEELLPIYFSSN